MTLFPDCDLGALARQVTPPLTRQAAARLRGLLLDAGYTDTTDAPPATMQFLVALARQAS